MKLSGNTYKKSLYKFNVVLQDKDLGDIYTETFSTIAGRYDKAFSKIEDAVRNHLKEENDIVLDISSVSREKIDNFIQ